MPTRVAGLLVFCIVQVLLATTFAASLRKDGNLEARFPLKSPESHDAPNVPTLGSACPGTGRHGCCDCAAVAPSCVPIHTMQLVTGRRTAPVAIGMVIVAQLESVYRVSVFADACWSLMHSEMYLSRQSLPLSASGLVNPATWPVQHEFELGGSHNDTHDFTLADIAGTGTSCLDDVTFAFHAVAKCDCGQTAASDQHECHGKAGAQSAWAHGSSGSFPATQFGYSSMMQHCCSVGRALVDNHDHSIDAAHRALLPELLFDSNRKEKPSAFASVAAANRAGAVEVDSELQLHELHARQLDDQGTTGESSPTVVCVPTVPVFAVHATSIEVSFVAGCTKRALHQYTLMFAGGSAPDWQRPFTSEAPSWSYTVSGLTTGRPYRFKVCDHVDTPQELCSPETLVTPAAEAAANVQADNRAPAPTSAWPAWLVGVVVAVVIVAIVAAILIATLIARRRQRSNGKNVPPTSPVSADEPPVTTVVAAEDDDEEDDSVYLDREGGLREEKRQRTLNELLSEYESHRPRLLKRKGTSAESSASVFSTSWDSDDEEEWSRLSQAATRVQAAWRGYAVRHPRNSGAAAAAAHRLSVSAAMSGFDVLIEQLRAAGFGTSTSTSAYAQASTAMLELLGRIKRAAGILYGADAADDDSLLMLLPEDIAAAINALSFAVTSLLSVGEEGFEAAAANVLKQKAVLEGLFADAVQPAGSAQPDLPQLGQARSWSAFKSLLHEFRGKKAALEGTPDQDAAQLQLLEQFRMHAESLLPDDEHDMEESSATAEDSNECSIDSTSSRNSSGSWVQMKAILQQYRAGRPPKQPVDAVDAADGLSATARQRIQRGGDRWAERNAILERLEMHLTKAQTDKDSDSLAVISGVSRVPKPVIRNIDIAPAPSPVLERTALPWVVRETGSHNVKFAEPEDSEELDESGSSEMSSEASAESASSKSAARRGVGSPLFKTTPVKFQKRTLKPRGEQPAANSSRRNAGLASDSSSSHSAESSADMSFEHEVPELSAEATKALSADTHGGSSSPRFLRRRIRKSGDGQPTRDDNDTQAQQV
eukprot:TRINITY_DN766_c0_g1_i3.p1 TRINITY_DN766_c0_g1~~TRINITY_DN766_c0_g1_i3.p1  ORF type:complete len:1051 (+),score=396.67 TRINITY_DN766_c0_g1_i3:98-3250(+)